MVVALAGDSTITSAVSPPFFERGFLGVSASSSASTSAPSRASMGSSSTTGLTRALATLALTGDAFAFVLVALAFALGAALAGAGAAAFLVDTWDLVFAVARAPDPAIQLGFQQEPHHRRKCQPQPPGQPRRRVTTTPQGLDEGSEQGG